jgi:hypothetical protein
MMISALSAPMAFISSSPNERQRNIDMIEKKIVYEYEGKNYPSLEKAIDAVEGDFCTFVQDANNLLSHSMRLTHAQVTALVGALLENHCVALRLLTTIEDAKYADAT